MEAIGLPIIFLLFGLWLYIWLPVSMASKRGRSGLGWFLLTLLLSPLVTIIALLVLGPTFEQALANHRDSQNLED